jgi:hypothetical protein
LLTLGVSPGAVSVMATYFHLPASMDTAGTSSSSPCAPACPTSTVSEGSGGELRLPRLNAPAAVGAVPPRVADATMRRAASLSASPVSSWYRAVSMSSATMVPPSCCCAWPRSPLHNHQLASQGNSAVAAREGSSALCSHFSRTHGRRVGGGAAARSAGRGAVAAAAPDHRGAARRPHASATAVVQPQRGQRAREPR